ncbi:hypothetical protein [Candidatus Nitrosocosmicus arcticus]|uniref:Uncharacterized protein n=1 Tax=Candidatus Nitrosocosmicus arcticus TaxID=2035267 RepID=A0A557SYV8_9ARCH|nr:hypothetical protein [Candidatus Nitrosocosmicus arcticus]TVP41792.1 hypothetical protein NARC_10198 [Candidatus Nitrosocosmicus arcticus]
MEFLSEYYLSNDAINVESPSRSTIIEGVVEMDRIAQERKIKELTNEELAKFNFNISNKFRNKIRIDAVTIPNLVKNEYLLINAEVSGTISKGFLDLFIRDSIS